MFPLRSPAEIFFSRHYFFSTKTTIFKARSANRIFFSAHFTDRHFFSSKYVNRTIFSQKNHSPPPPFKLNGCSLTTLRTHQFKNVVLRPSLVYSEGASLPPFYYHVNESKTNNYLSPNFWTILQCKKPHITFLGNKSVKKTTPSLIYF